MQLHARLIHCEASRRIVLVWALEGERSLGSCLGEAATAEEAEDRAVARLLGRLAPDRSSLQGTPASVPPRRRDHPVPEPPPGPPPTPEPGPAETPEPEPEPQPEPQPGPEPQPQPENPPDDWSAELAGLDLQLQRLGWSREQEGTYLRRAFGHPSRQRITVYGDLMAYLRSLEGLQPGCDPASAPVPLRRGDLLQQNNALLQRLGWDADRGRTFLERQLGVSSRQQLSDEQLLRFNVLLESELLDATA